LGDDDPRLAGIGYMTDRLKRHRLRWPKAALSSLWKSRRKAGFSFETYLLTTQIDNDTPLGDDQPFRQDGLWELHQHVIEVLDRKLEDEKRRIQNRLDELGRKIGGSPKGVPGTSALRRKVPISSW
jgi:hypothetical protein